MAVESLIGLIVVIHLKKSSRLIVAGFAGVLLVLGGALTVLIVCLVYKEKLTSVAIAFTRFFGKVRHRPPAVEKIKTSVGYVVEGWERLLQGGWRGPVAGAILNTGFDMLTLGFLFGSAGYRIGITVLVAGYGIPQLLGKLTVILGGVGVVEAGMVVLYTVVGAAKPSTVAVVLAYRFLSFWIPTLVGLALIPYLERSTAMPGKAHDAAP